VPSRAKLFTSETTLDVACAATQLHGADGYAEGSFFEHLARNASAVTLHFDNNDFLRSFVGRTMVRS
jgi:alkylation response protein AidB-like acyl-CoA dehydrogenase